jgi:hypothetical protein
MEIEKLTEQSQNNVSHLMKKIRMKDCCVFIGSGLSSQADYPTWLGLLKILKKEAEDISGTNIDLNLNYYERAEKYKEILGNERFRNIITNEFNPFNNKQQFQPVHLDLLDIPFVSYITTNYDCLIENAFRFQGKPTDFHFYPLLPSTHLRDRQIIHIHGMIDYSNLTATQDSIVLTKSDIDEAYAPDSNLTKLINALYTELTIFFVGFNVHDPFMMKVLQECYSGFEKLKRISAQRSLGPLKEIEHFAILPYILTEDDHLGIKREIYEIDHKATSHDDTDLLLMGVNSIRYIPDSRNHTPLNQIIHERNTFVNELEEPRISQGSTFRGDNR